MRTLRNRLLSTALIVTVAGGVAACERDEPDSTLTTAAPTTAAPTTTSDAPPAGEQIEFCDAAAPLLVVVPREFVGTDEHVALYDDLAASAPDELQADIALLRAHYDVDVSPANPDSQDFKNFPADVQEAALRLSGELTERC